MLSNILVVLVAFCGLSLQCEKIEMLAEAALHHNTYTPHSHHEAHGEAYDEAHEHGCHCGSEGNEYDCCDLQLAVVFSPIDDLVRLNLTDSGATFVTRLAFNVNVGTYRLRNNDPPTSDLRQRMGSLMQNPNSPPRSVLA